MSQYNNNIDKSGETVCTTESDSESESESESEEVVSGYEHRRDKRVQVNDVSNLVGTNKSNKHQAYLEMMKRLETKTSSETLQSVSPIYREKYNLVKNHPNKILKYNAIREMDEAINKKEIGKFQALLSIIYDELYLSI